MRSESPLMRLRLKAIWRDSERLDRYFSWQSSVQTKIHNIQASILFGAIFLAGAIQDIPQSWPLDDGQPSLYAILFFSWFPFLVIASFSATLHVYGFSRKAAIYKFISEQCRDISRECLNLWCQYPLPSNALEMISNFEIRVTNATKSEVIRSDSENDSFGKEADQYIDQFQDPQPSPSPHPDPEPDTSGNPPTPNPRPMPSPDPPPEPSPTDSNNNMHS